MDMQSLLAILDEISKVISHVMAIAAFVALIVKPVRDRVFGMKDVREAQKCQLRSDMLRIYYRHKDEGKIRQYEKENFLYEYAAYKALGGNSFIDDITQEVRKWEVLP